MNKNEYLGKGKDSTQCRLVESFWAFVPAFQRWAESQTCQRGISPQRTRILASLNEKGPQIMSELRDLLGVTATNITALVDALEKDGLVERKAHPTDRRATIIEITEIASRQFAEACSAYSQRVGQLFASLTDKDQKELLRLMHLLQERLEPEVPESKTDSLKSV